MDGRSYPYIFLLFCFVYFRSSKDLSCLCNIFKENIFYSIFHVNVYISMSGGLKSSNESYL
jgi:hypothetical protein